MINVPTVVARHNRDDKPAGTEYFYLDGNNKTKAHHIIINDQGEVFYNQAILSGRGDEESPHVWQDFYEWALVKDGEWHGYRFHIEKAEVSHRAAAKAARKEARKAAPVADNSYMELWSNQALRPAQMIGHWGPEALVVYRMPAGRYTIAVLRHNAALADFGDDTNQWPQQNSCVRGHRYEFVRTHPRGKIPKRLADNLDLDLLDEIIENDYLMI